MNAKTLIGLLSQLDPLADVAILMLPNWSLDLSDDVSELDECRHELACEIDLQQSDVVLASVEGHHAWLVVRPPEAHMDRSDSGGLAGRLRNKAKRRTRPRR